MESVKLDEAIIQQTREEKIIKAKELYSNGSKNFLIRNYNDAADELSQVCELYGELYGEFSDELGLPYLLYAKSLIALALDENKVIDVPEEQDDDDDDDEDDENESNNGEEKDEAKEQTTTSTSSQKTPQTNGISSQTNEKQLKSINEDEADSTEKDDTKESNEEGQKTEFINHNLSGSEKGDATVTSTGDSTASSSSKNNSESSSKVKENIPCSSAAIDEKPSTSNGETAENTTTDDVEDENETASNLQLAWEILETAAKIFARQGIAGLPNLADVQTELANIELENNIPEGAREDYQKAIKIYKELSGNYRRAMAELHYKIGLTFLMQQMDQEAANSLKEACILLDAEIMEISQKDVVTEKDKIQIQDMQETKQEILDKITEIEETRDQNIAEVRAALKNFISPVDTSNGAGPSSTSSTSTSDNAGISSSSAISSSTLKPNDISHLIKRKKPDSASDCEAEAAESPMKKRPI